MNYASIAVAVAGLIHLWLGPQHYSHAPVHGIFFVAAGLAQLTWAYFYHRQPTRQIYLTGLFLTGGLSVLWAITRIATQPFHGHPGSIDVIGILCKMAELIGLAGMVLTASTGSIKGVAKRSFASMLGAALLISIATGFFTYGVAVAAENVLPQSGGHSQHSEDNEGENAHGEEDSHHEEEHSD